MTEPTVAELARAEADIHKSRFYGSPRKLKGESFGKWVRVGNKLIYVAERHRHGTTANRQKRKRQELSHGQA
jgi:hypothetical protein